MALEDLFYIKDTLTLGVSDRAQTHRREKHEKIEPLFVRVEPHTYYGISGASRVLITKDIVGTCIIGYARGKDTFGLLANLHPEARHHPNLALQMSRDLIKYAQATEQDVNLIASVPLGEPMPRYVGEMYLLFPYKEIYTLTPELQPDMRRACVFNVAEGTCQFFRYVLGSRDLQNIGIFDLKKERIASIDPISSSHAELAQLIQDLDEPK